MTEAVHHNHVTRDIKSKGKCPACDRYWVQEAKKETTTRDAAEMAQVIMLSCPTKMKPETALHYGENLVNAGFGKLPIPPARESAEWDELVVAAADLGTAAARFQHARNAYVAKYPKENQ